MTDETLTPAEKAELQKFLKFPNEWIAVLPKVTPFRYEYFLSLEAKGFIRKAYSPKPEIAYYTLILD